MHNENMQCQQMSNNSIFRRIQDFQPNFFLNSFFGTNSYGLYHEKAHKAIEVANVTLAMSHVRKTFVHF